MRKLILLAAISMFVSFLSLQAASTGKIVGTVKDAKTGEALIGANVIIKGTNMGAATNVEGYFAILNVPPGTYEVRASMVGYAPQTLTQVRVNIDQTTTLEFELLDKSIETDEVVVTAEQPVVQKDVSSSGANLNVEEIENLPVVTTENVVGLQAGVQGLSVRGGYARETAFVVNGINLRDGRDNTPYTNISFTSVKQIKVQTGGFNAEYGDIRSGLVSVVTKDGPKDHYTFSFLGRYSPTAQKHFGPSPYDENAYYIRPYIDPAVAWTGTDNGNWDEYTRNQYPEFEGWNNIARKSLEDDNPNNDLTPEAARRLFLFQHRRVIGIDKPDYDMDMSFGGPVPIISESLGNLRFFASYNRNRDMYLYPLSEESFQDYNASLKLTADLTKGMKLMVDGLMGQQSGTTYSQSGNPGLFQAPWSVATRFDRVSYIEARLFATDYWAPSQINRNSLGLKLTHAITSQTYYEVTFNTFGSHYDTAPGALRDTSKTYKFGNNYYVDESPFGFWPYSPGDNSASPAVNDMRVSGGMSTSRDSSFIRYYKLKFDITSQLDEYNEIKSGFEVQYTHNHTSYGRYDAAFQTTNVYQEWTTYPIQAAFYIQDKLEFEGMVANVGVRFDYSNPNGSWWQYSTYDPAFAAENEDQRGELLKRTELEGQLTVSPRLGVSFPVSQNSKIFFNYGHFRDLPTPEHLYLRRSSFTGQLTRIANPDMPFPKTVAYELGYEQNLLDQYLLRLTGYYKDISNENTTVDYISRDGKVDYSISEPATYRDIRGFELSLRKNRGDWVRGFVNYTYMVSSFGRFGWGQYYQSPTEQRQYQRTSDWHIQIQPVPQPYARANIDFFTPMEFGPEFMGMFPLEDIRFNILATWSSGDYFTWTNGQDIQGYNNNVQWKDNWNVNIRLSKEFNFTDAISLQLFVSVNNVFNFKQFSQYGFVDVYDYRRYMRSLHLPAGDVRDDFGYVNIPGDDKPGDYRSVGAEFTPIEAVNNVYEVSSSDIKQGVIYWDQSTGKYMQMAEDGSDWQQVSSSRMDKIKENKSYIDMPNLKFNTFLNPRDIFWGLRMNINF